MLRLVHLRAGAAQTWAKRRDRRLVGAALVIALAAGCGSQDEASTTTTASDISRTSIASPATSTSSAPTTTSTELKAEQFPIGSFTDQNGFTYSAVATSPDLTTFVDPNSTPPGQVDLRLGDVTVTVTNTSPDRTAEFNQVQHDLKYMIVYHYPASESATGCQGRSAEVIDTAQGAVCLQYLYNVGYVKPPAGFTYDLTDLSATGKRIPVGGSIDLTSSRQGRSSVPESAGEASSYYWTVYAAPFSVSGRKNMTGDAPPVWYSADGSGIPPEAIPVINRFVEDAWMLGMGG